MKMKMHNTGNLRCTESMPGNVRGMAFSTFDKQCTTFIKGLAVMLMVCHHMWAFRDVGDFTGAWGGDCGGTDCVGQGRKNLRGGFHVHQRLRYLSVLRAS